MTSQGMIKEQELIKSELRSELTRKASYTAVNPIGSNQLLNTSDGKAETKFLNDLINLIGIGKEKVNYESVLRRLKKQQRFTQKIMRIVSDVEGKKTDSLTDCLRWVKGLLQDFILLRSKACEQELAKFSQI